jgi:hypothetical protein
MLILFFMAGIVKPTGHHPAISGNSWTSIYPTGRRPYREGTDSRLWGSIAHGWIYLLCDLSPVL